MGDQAGGEAGEGFVDVVGSLPADPQSSEAVQPGDRALYCPIGEMGIGSASWPGDDFRQCRYPAPQWRPPRRCPTPVHALPLDAGMQHEQDPAQGLPIRGPRFAPHQFRTQLGQQRLDERAQFALDDPCPRVPPSHENSHEPASHQADRRRPRFITATTRRGSGWRGLSSRQRAAHSPGGGVEPLLSCAGVYDQAVPSDLRLRGTCASRRLLVRGAGVRRTSGPDGVRHLGGLPSLTGT